MLLQKAEFLHCQDWIVFHCVDVCIVLSLSTCFDGHSGWWCSLAVETGLQWTWKVRHASRRWFQTLAPSPTFSSLFAPKCVSIPLFSHTQRFKDSFAHVHFPCPPFLSVALSCTECPGPEGSLSLGNFLPPEVMDSLIHNLNPQQQQQQQSSSS